MVAFIGQRLILLAATLLFASLVVFGVLEALPGNAAQVMLGANATPETLAALTHSLGLDQGLAARYAAWIGGALHGDFGRSFAYASPIAPLIAQRLAVSAPLALLAMALAVALALSGGVFAARRHGRSGDLLVMTASQIGLSIPSFWFGILLALIFAVRLRWFPSGGFPGWDAGLLPAMRALVLPAVTLGVVQGAILTRVTRSALLDVLNEDFVRTARAKGLSRAATLWGHALPNALTPILTVMGLQFANLIAGAIVIENVFTLPGIGRLIFQSISNRDVFVVEDCVLLIAAIVIVVNFLVDVACAAIDPRLRRASS
jgi:peptide/nickel transport system permease protein